MISNIVSAYYFNPIEPINTPWNDTVEAYTLRWLVSGEADFIINSEKIHLNSGQILLSKPSSNVTMDFNKNDEIIYSISAFEGDLSLLQSLPFEKPLTISAMEHELLFQYFYTATQYYNDSSAIKNSESIKQYLLSLLNMILLKFDIQNGENKKIVFSNPSKTITQVYDQGITSDIKEYLRKNISTSISLKKLSDELGVSVNTAMHIFKKNVGMGIIEYFNKLKIERAMSLISEGELSFRTISERLGFETPEYFSRVFKKQTGMTPTEYSKQQSKWSGCLANFFM